MTIDNHTFNNITIGVLAIAGIMLVIALGSLVAMTLRWQTPRRRTHAGRFAISFAAVGILIGGQQAMLRRLVAPPNQTQDERELSQEQLLDGISVGTRSPQFSLTTIDGEDFSVADSNEVVLLNFFSLSCIPCRHELPHLETISKETAGQEGFRLFVIGCGETESDLKQFRDKHGFTFPIAGDPDRKLTSMFAAQTIPRTFIVSPDGRIVYAHVGFDLDEFQNMRDVLVNELGVVLGDAGDTSKRQPVFPYDLDDETYSPVESTIDSSGFVIAGANTSQQIRALTELNGLPISEIESLMRPGDSDPRMSKAGFLGPEEKLLDVLVEDNDFVTSRGLTHRQLAIPLRQLMNLADLSRAVSESNPAVYNAEFTHAGKNWKVEFFYTDGTQYSPFNDQTDSGNVYTITNLENNQTLQVAELVAVMIERYGFYEGHGTTYRVPPSSIIDLLGLKANAD